MSDDPLVAKRGDIFRQFIDDPWFAHNFFFEHRHRLAASPIHKAFVADFWAPRRYSQILAFRGSAKSTYAEEDIVLAACYRFLFRNILIIGSSERRAAERLASVIHELKTNERIERVFGPQDFTTDTQTRIVTAGGVCIQAMGRDQDIRGIKHLEWRPDLVLADDFEDKDTVQTPEGRAKTLRWFLADLLPACAPHRRVRVRATPMDQQSVPMRLWKESDWTTAVYPIESLDAEGKPAPTWPAAFPADWIERERELYRRLGEMTSWSREFMCEAVSDAERDFLPEMIRVEPRVRTWQAVYSMHDPARTTNRRSATTGKAVWSWVSNRLVVWRSDAQLWKPDEIVADILDTAEEFRPVWAGVEEDGLNEFLMQPLRHEKARRRLDVPLKAVRAPRDKHRFIRGLQDFFKAREVIFAGEQRVLTEQLMSFPTGRIDAPNALAYALLMRPGAPIYDNFSEEAIDPNLRAAPGQPLYLAANATGAIVTAILLQAEGGALRILADWIREGTPPELVSDIHAEAALWGDVTRIDVTARPANWHEALKIPAARSQLVRLPIAWRCPPHHWNDWNNVGLAQAIRRIPAEVRRGAAEDAGREYLRERMSRRTRGAPALLVSENARWTLGALTGGYSRALGKNGVIAAHAEEGPYRVLIEGLESFCGLLASGIGPTPDDSGKNFAYDAQGRRYESAMPSREAR